jgi:hypothetical protein
LEGILPGTVVVTFAISMAGFFLMYAWSFNNGWVASEAAANHFHGDPMFENIIKLGVVNTIITTTLLMAPVYFMLRRWKLPFGTITFMFTLEHILMSALEGFGNFHVILIGIISGLVPDIWLKKPVKNMRLFALVIPALIWSLFYFGVALSDGMGWDAEVWGGAIFLGSLCSLGLYLLAFPPQYQITDQRRSL